MKGKIIFNHRPFSEKEMIFIRKELENRNELILISIVNLIVNTGLRRAEIKKAINNFNEKLDILVIVGKGHKKREIAINSITKKELMFLNTQTLNIDSQAKKLFRISKKINFKVSFHNFRSTFANDLKMTGISIKTIQDLLGHSNLNTTQIYLSTSAEEKINAVESLKIFKMGNYTKEELFALFIQNFHKNKKQEEEILNLKNKLDFLERGKIANIYVERDEE